MKNRFNYSRLVLLLSLAFSFASNPSLFGQSNCACTITPPDSVCVGRNNFWSLKYIGGTVRYVDHTTCKANVNVESQSVVLTVPLGWTINTFSNPPIGSSVHAGSTVKFHYFLSNGGNRTDTLCFQVTYKDSIAPKINTSLLSPAVPCTLANYRAWWEAQIDSLETTSTDNCNIDTIYHNGPLDTFLLCGTVNLVFTVRDSSGNVADKVASYTFVDNVKPQFFGIPKDTTIACGDAIPPAPAPGTVTATDNCSALPINHRIVYGGETSTRTTGTGLCTDFGYVIRRTWSVTDSCGNRRDSTWTINVVDNVAPTFSVPSDVTIDCSADTSRTALGDITAILENCDPNRVVTFNQTISTGTCPIKYTITRTWTVRDACNNQTTKSQVISVRDTIKPSGVFPPDITVDCGNANRLEVTGVPVSLNDNCTPVPTYIKGPDTLQAGSCPSNYTIRRPWIIRDACGNEISQLQVITVVDSFPPRILSAARDTILNCTSNADDAFASWLAMKGRAVASDNCTPTDSLTWQMFKFGTNDPPSLPSPDCGNMPQGIYRQAKVKFVVTDKCGGIDSTSATFTVRDDSPPTVICPSDMLLNPPTGTCEINELVPWPIVTDNCNNAVDTVNITIPKKLFTNQPGDVNETPVDSMVFEFSVSGPPSSAASNATLTIKMIKTDAEEPTEYLNVFGENGFFLDRLPNTSAQCGDATKIFTLTPTQINSWAIDGKIRITLKPNIPQGMPGRFAVNNICPDGGIEASLNFVRNRPNNLVFEYSLNGGPRVSSSVPVTLPLGAHNASYFFIDCANNETVCNFKVTVEDKELPRLLCPPNVTINTAPGVCTTDVDVPLYVSVTDNCGIVDPTQQTQPATTSASRFITYNYNPNLTDWIANDKTFVFKGLPANATPGNVEIIISFKGDMESVGEYFSIFDNDNVLLGTTQVGQLNVTPGNCTTEGKAVFTVSAAKFNQWASGDSIKIRAVSNISFAIPPAGVGSGINPCNPAKVVNNGDIDSVSYIYATIRYESARPKFWGTGANVFDTLQLDPPLQPRKLALKRGRTTFTYSITDKNGNTGSCSFDVNVQDVEKPIAKCGPTFININPSGFIVDTIFPSLINIGSSDNCGIASMTVTPSTVTCNQAGVLPVYLVVRDSSGNTDTCRTFVNVSTIQPSPTVLTRCTGTSIQLFANPPASPGGSTTVFKFTWKNPAGVVFSFDRNPIIQNVGPQTVGFYVVEIEGLTGCKSSASVQVTCEMLPLQKPVLSAVSNTICIENDINLSTDAVCGATTKYKWYSGTAPSGTLLQTTTVPTFTNRPSTPGTYSFYVVVERDTCTSEVSNSISVLVHPKPVAIPEFSDTSICAGQPLLLKTINTPLTATCYWTGPCGFESFKCNPDLIGAATVCNSGLYQVIVTNNNCASDPAFVAVNVIELPKQPTLINSTSANSPTCQGSSVTLTASAVQSAVSYQWTTPTLQIISTPTNVLTINQANAAEHGGQWTVKIIGNPCESLPSSATFVYIATPPTSLTASATPATVCEGQNIQLSATSASPNVTFHWSYPNGLTSALQNPLIANVSTANKGNYILRVTNEFGCSRNDTVAVEVFGRVKINGGSSNVPTCVTGPVNVNILALLFPPDPGNYSYLWTGPNGYSSVEDTATISNGTIANSGPYTLVVTNDKGCSSLPFTVNVAIPAIPPTPSSPMLSAPNPFCIGDNATLTTSPFQGSNAVYLWKKPSGEEETTSFPSLALSSLSRNDSGAYSVRYVINGCQSSASGLSTLTVNPIPEANLTAPATVCEGQELKLGVQCTSGATYEWTGPGGFSSSVCNPVITSANPNLHSGTYSVRRRLNGCWSATVRADVLVKPRPVIPTALNAGPYCGNTENAVLSISPNTATPGASYHWYNSIGNPLGESTTLLNFNIPNPLSYGNGSNEFYVIATLDGCNSLPSVPTLVRFNSIPTNVAEAGPDIKACEGDIVTLKATPVTIGTGLWTIIGEAGGVTIANPDNATTTATGLAPAKTYKFRWTLSNGACKNYSFDTTLVAVDKKETAEAGESVVACHTTVATLKAVAPTSGTGLWTQSQAQQLLGVTITNPSNPSTTVSGMLPGNNYVFTWTITNNCGSSSDAVQVKVTNEDAFAGTDFNECGDGCLKLNGTGALSGVGMWTSPDPNLRFATPTDPKTNVCNLKVGTNILVWTIDRGVCGHFSVDTVVIGYQYAPELQDDQLNIPFNAKGSVNILSNDKILGSYNLVISKQPEFGTVTFDQTGALTYVPSRAYVGRDVITYQVCIDNCRCISANVNIIVGDKAECQPPSIITPNKDGMNDAFIIPCMGNGTLYPRSRVSIFNQWGDEVFRAAPYKNDWEGTYDGQDLPAGTYFYILDFGTGDKPTSGYLILQR